MAFGTLPESTGRIMWIDTAKGIGIILVVIGHICDIR
jgi:fucose 4-O-acetylase-like acetyltransferase